MGDDVHAIALYRGFIEIVAKLNLVDQFKEDYVKYKKYNIYLQEYKYNGKPLPKIMIEELGSKATNEGYIAYGWAKNKNGNRITTLKELLKVSSNYNPQIDKFLQISSEFIHEDYVGIGYDFISLRKQYIDIYYELITKVFDSFKDIFKLNEFKEMKIF